MSSKQITIATETGITLELSVFRRVTRHRKMVKPFLFEHTGLVTKKVTVQYGLGISGEGASLKEAIADFRANWDFFCLHHHEIMMGNISAI